MVRPSVAFGLVVIVASVAVGGCAVVAPDPNEVCDGVPREMGGCDNPQPTFLSRSCEDLAVEIGTMLDERELAIIDGPRSFAGKDTTVRVTEAVFLVTSRADQHATRLGFQCPVDVMWPIVEAQFSERLRSEIPGVISDPTNYQRGYEDFAADVRRSLHAIATNEVGG